MAQALPATLMGGVYYSADNNLSYTLPQLESRLKKDDVSNVIKECIGLIALHPTSPRRLLVEINLWEDKYELWMVRAALVDYGLDISPHPHEGEKNERNKG